MGVVEFIEGTMFLGSHRIHTFATGFVAGGVLLREGARSHESNLEQFGFQFFDLGLDLLAGFTRHRDIV
jgi:hypothetical protein